MSVTACPGYTDVKPARLRWLAPGRVVSRTQRSKRTTSDKVHNNEAPTKSVQKLSHRISDMSVPHFELRTESCALPEAVEYCKRTPQIWNMLT